ncbi:hypothetical protein GBAR_LOCUS25629 [Geodia barretti]|uniref:Uncharacterized protein n=1 Tax=Geodia barretti TaxID=519541 RepID=A0AA35TDJ5_GEOBA|nr:hypothetical protein GBAR_LOCUS25629 [Geodia barretti]
MDMSRSLIAGLVLLLSATSVVGTGDANSTECVSQQELAAVKAEMESKVGKLHSLINYWQGVTVNNIFQDHCKTASSSETSPGCSGAFTNPAVIGASAALLVVIIVLITVVVIQCVLLVKKKRNTETHVATKSSTAHSETYPVDATTSKSDYVTLNEAYGVNK